MKIKIPVILLIFILYTIAQDRLNYPKTISAAVETLLVSLNDQDKFLLKNTKPKN